MRIRHTSSWLPENDKRPPAEGRLDPTAEGHYEIPPACSPGAERPARKGANPPSPRTRRLLGADRSITTLVSSFPIAS